MKKQYVVLVVALAVAFQSLPALAAGDSGSHQPNAIVTAEPFDMTGSFFRMVGGLLFCLGVFGVGIHVLKRYGGHGQTSGKRRLKVVERVAITGKTSLVLVTLDGKELLVAAGPDRTQLIHSTAMVERDFVASLDQYALPDEKEKAACVG